MSSLCVLDHLCKWCQQWSFVNGMQHSGRRANGLPLCRCLATVNCDVYLPVIEHRCWAMLPDVWFWYLFACTMIYLSSLAVVFLGRPTPIFLTVAPVIWKASQALEATLLSIPNSWATFHKLCPSSSLPIILSSVKGYWWFSCSLIEHSISHLFARDS